MIYLDSAATTLQKPPAVSRAVAHAIKELASPGRGGHRPSARAAELVYRCREEAASLFGMDCPENVIFTSNATHSLNVAIHSLVRPGDKVLISGYEHNAVTRPLHAIGGVQIREIGTPLFQKEAFLLEFNRQITTGVKCVIITHVSNVFGYILPVDEVAKGCREAGIPLIVDVSQSAGCLPVDMKRWGATFVCMPGHKGLFGPQGTGLLLCGEGEKVPLLQGGTGSGSARQEMPDFLPDRLEAGTHNVCGIAGLLAGISYVKMKGIENIFHHEEELVKQIASRLSTLNGVEVFVSSEPGLQGGVLSFRARKIDCELLGERLAERGIAVRAGLHCAPYAHRTVGTLGTGTVRVSFSTFNTEKEMKRFGRILAEILDD